MKHRDDIGAAAAKFRVPNYSDGTTFEALLRAIVEANGVRVNLYRSGVAMAVFHSAYGETWGLAEEWVAAGLLDVVDDLRAKRGKSAVQRHASTPWTQLPLPVGAA